MRRSGGRARTYLCRTLAALLLGSASSYALAQRPYHFYGGDVSGEGTNAAIEACEYDRLVEKHTCNNALNKNACFDRVRAACRATFADWSGDAEALQRRLQQPLDEPAPASGDRQSSGGQR
ncbi:MAG: hypothetical protein V2I82_03875 [Halieaceae bacterium]|jgi:hypothetical protein|nr:hypothetical protein [Halieaceae bacterium]